MEWLPVHPSPRLADHSLAAVLYHLENELSVISKDEIVLINLRSMIR